ncbi:MAG: queuosine salvage family protein [Candidatus Levybacteria bacterium]|nr:queuosine salvage family protein [Candidatus Levybacteria bacterium]
MNFKITSDDPFRVLASTLPIVESLKYVKIHKENLDRIAEIISDKLKSGIAAEEMHFEDAGNLRDNIQLIFLEDVVNFCFWAEKGKPKWEVEWPKGSKTVDGWFALTECFVRTLVQNKPILKTTYLENISLKDVRSIFMGSNGAEVPLLEERMKNLQEAGKVLKVKYDGEFINVLEKAEYDAIKLVQLILTDFPSFRDIAKLDGKEIYFLKRAQICALDLSYIKNLKIKNISALSAFADYKIPQILRKFGIISYKQELANKIDSYAIIPSGSMEEIEIRAATIWCIELIKQKLGKYTSADIDNALWLLSQDKSGVKPYHRTYSIYY